MVTHLVRTFFTLALPITARFITGYPSRGFMKVPCLVESIFFKGKLEVILRQLGHEAVFVDRVGALAGHKVVVVDGAHVLSQKAVEHYPLRCRVFIRHTAKEEIARLKAAGCQHVYARSEFFADVKGILEG